MRKNHNGSHYHSGLARRDAASLGHLPTSTAAAPGWVPGPAEVRAYRSNVGGCNKWLGGSGARPCQPASSPRPTHVARGPSGMIDPPTNRTPSSIMSTDSRISGGRRHTRGVAGDELRRHNLGTILERLHLSGPESRSDLVAATGLNRSTIGDLVGQLTDLGMVEETADPAASGPGRPSPLVQTRPQGATVLAVELAVDSVAVATVGLGGHIYNRLRVERPRGHRSPDETVLDVSRLAEPLLDALPGPEVPGRDRGRRGGDHPSLRRVRPPRPQPRVAGHPARRAVRPGAGARRPGDGGQRGRPRSVGRVPQRASPGRAPGVRLRRGRYRRRRHHRRQAAARVPPVTPARRATC